MTALLESGIDAVTITTPPETRRALVLESLAADVHVLADKPFAPSAEAAQKQLARTAKDAGVILNVFHNRRWDADIRTLARGARGRPARRPLARAHSLRPGPATPPGAGARGRTAGDLVSHVVDQMLWLLGPVQAVTAHLDWVDLPEGRTDAGFVVDLLHTSGVRSYVESSKLNHVAERRLRPTGTRAATR